MSGERKNSMIFKKIAIITLFGLLSPLVCQAEVIKIGLTGQVDFVDDRCNLLGGAIQQGDLFNGYYAYDSTTPDTEPSISGGFYVNTIAPYGMFITIGDITFQTDPDNVNMDIAVSNNYYGESYDYYGVTSRKNLPLNNGLTIDGIHWQLDDHTGTALSNDSLPVLPPDLLKWNTKSWNIMGGRYPFPPPPELITVFGIGGHVTSVYLIPEPTTLLLLGWGGLISLKKRSYPV